MSEQEIIDLIIARLRTVPEDAALSVGESSEGYSPSQLISEVKNSTDIGKKFVETQLNFLRSLKDLNFNMETDVSLDY